MHLWLSLANASITGECTYNRRHSEPWQSLESDRSCSVAAPRPPCRTSGLRRGNVGMWVTRPRDGHESRLRRVQCIVVAGGLLLPPEKSIRICLAACSAPLHFASTASFVLDQSFSRLAYVLPAVELLCCANWRIQINEQPPHETGLVSLSEERQSVLRGLSHSTIPFPRFSD